jgi:hypothetical protein
MSDPDRSLLAYLAPPPELPLWRWAEGNIVLTDRQSTAFPGPYRTRYKTRFFGRKK